MHKKYLCGRNRSTWILQPNVLNDRSNGRTRVTTPYEIVAGRANKETRFTRRNRSNRKGRRISKILERSSISASASDRSVDAEYQQDEDEGRRKVKDGGDPSA